MPELVQFYRSSLWAFGIILTSIVIFIWLFVIGGIKHDVDEIEMHAEDFGGVVSEGYGKSTIYLWLSEAVILLWIVYYLTINWQQFYVIFASQS
jgi:hypothetical protein